MNLQQLRALQEVVYQNMSVSDAARVLCISQSAVSRQLTELEDELGVRLLIRAGRRISGLTPAGLAVIETVYEMLNGSQKLRRISADFANEKEGELVVAVTHTQARYSLPPVVQQFMAHYPEVRLSLIQNSPPQIIESLRHGSADIGIATESMTSETNLVVLPCHQWYHWIIAPHEHRLWKSQMSLAHLAQFPLITYNSSFAGRTAIDTAFAQQELRPNIVLSAMDSDVIKTYVHLGMGVGIVAGMAWDKERDKDLRSISAKGLFPPKTTCLAFRRDAWLRGFVYDFIRYFAPHLSRDVVEKAQQTPAVSIGNAGAV